MTDLSNPFGVLSEPATLTIQRILPGPAELVWLALTESELRRHWLAAGEMELRLGAAFELVWRNDELTDPSRERPPGFAPEHRMWARITELDPPRKLSFTWDGSGEVSFELKPRGGKVLLTVTHRGLIERATRLGVSAGWHMHLDILVVRAGGLEPEPFWDGWLRLKQEYARRLAA
jgi:uncharacterized protein YndB with AHSA1/START domain